MTIAALMAALPAAGAPSVLGTVEADRGLVRMRLPDGEVIATHGPDSEDLAAVSTSVERVSVTPRPVSCVHDPEAPAFQVLYAYPRDHGSRMGSALETIRRAVRLANGILVQSARESSGGTWAASLRVRCDARGQISVRRFAVTDAGDDATGESLADIVASGRFAGFRDTMTKYVVFWDSAIPGMCGQGQLTLDPRRSLNNANNRGGVYAVAYGRSCWLGGVALHEIGHTMGAVQNNAPHATGTGHCNQEHDIMCYPDGGPDGRIADISTSCASARFDCGHNDYFKVGRARGYLATHWNLGWTGNRFLRFARR